MSLVGFQFAMRRHSRQHFLRFRSGEVSSEPGQQNLLTGFSELR